MKEYVADIPPLTAVYFCAYCHRYFRVTIRSKDQATPAAFCPICGKAGELVRYISAK